MSKHKRRKRKQKKNEYDDEKENDVPSTPQYNITANYENNQHQQPQQLIQQQQQQVTNSNFIYPQTNVKIDESDSDSDEDEDDELIGDTISEKKKKKRINYITEVILSIVLIITVAQAIQIFILHYYSNESIIMMICGYTSVFLAVVAMISTCLRWTFYLRKEFDAKYKIFFIYLFTIVFGFSIVQAMAVMIIVYRQASENFWTLFLDLPFHVRALLVSSTVTCFVLFVIFIFIIFFRREKFFSNPIQSQINSKINKKKKKKKKKKVYNSEKI